jgi:hypothetical protein
MSIWAKSVDGSDRSTRRLRVKSLPEEAEEWTPSGIGVDGMILQFLQIVNAARQTKVENGLDLTNADDRAL